MCWSPTNPSLFATAHDSAGDGGGHLNLWDLCHSTEDPKVTLPLASLLNLSGNGGGGDGGGRSEQGVSAAAGAGATPVSDFSFHNKNSNGSGGGGKSSSSSSSLSKVAWSPDGRRLALGDLDGRVHVLALAADLADPRWSWCWW